MSGDVSGDANQSLTEEEAAAQRQSVRKRVLRKARIAVAGRSHGCAVIDLSLGGARLHFAETVAQGTPVVPILDRFGSFRAEVVWQKDRGVGLRYIDDLQRFADMIGGRLPLTAVRAAASA